VAVASRPSQSPSEARPSTNHSRRNGRMRRIDSRAGSPVGSDRAAAARSVSVIGASSSAAFLPRRCRREPPDGPALPLAFSRGDLVMAAPPRAPGSARRGVTRRRSDRGLNHPVSQAVARRVAEPADDPGQGGPARPDRPYGRIRIEHRNLPPDNALHYILAELWILHPEATLR
jgi:hypothetical protein